MLECAHHCGWFREDLGLLICRPTGVLNRERAEDLLLCQNCLRKAGLPKARRFHDLTGIHAVSLRFDDIIAMLLTDGVRVPAGENTIACYLAQSDSVYGTLRMYQSLADGKGAEIHVSRDIEELAAALGVPEPSQLRGPDAVPPGQGYS